MRVNTGRPWRQASKALGESREDGRMSILVLGLVAIGLSVVLGTVGVTAAQLSRVQLLDAADAAALDASDAIAREHAYARGIGEGLPVTDRTVREAAAEHLAARPVPERIESWQLEGATGTPDGRTAVVALSGTARIPVLTPVLRALGGGVTITVTSRARSDLVQE